ncbi:MAG: Rrf2 family transcriptional regulator [Desulfobacteraceae bacterium]|nr:MAG: Rrf2 family transcriptional regulator [Desulfobacteraceae bacterium]
MVPMTPKKNQYALRAVFELAKRRGEGPTKISDIARAQVIPARFLEVILNKLKRSGLIESKRGFTGGYFLSRPPDTITVGDIMRFLDGPTAAMACAACTETSSCPSHRRGCAFSAMWNRVNQAVLSVYNDTTIQDLLDNDVHLKAQRRRRPPRASARTEGQRL